MERTITVGHIRAGSTITSMSMDMAVDNSDYDMTWVVKDVLDKKLLLLTED